MEPIESSETSAHNNTLTPGTYPKEKKLLSKHGESLKSRMFYFDCFCWHFFVEVLRYSNDAILLSESRNILPVDVVLPKEEKKYSKYVTSPATYNVTFCVCCSYAYRTSRKNCNGI